MAYSGEVTITQNSQSVSGNYSNITVKYYAVTDSEYSTSWSNYKTYPYLGIYYGSKKHEETQTLDSFDFGTNKKILLGTITMNIPHNSDGSMTVSASFTWDSDHSNIGTITGSNSKTLTKIPREPTSNQSFKSKTETSISMNWSSDSTIKAIKYSTDGGTNWSKEIDVTDGKSGSYTISGLSAYETYKIKTRVIRKDNSLYKDSSTLSVTTYDYPYCTSSPDFVIGSDVTLKFYNPLGREFTFYIIANGITIANSWTKSGTSYTGISATSSQEQLYATIPNATSAKYQVKVVYGSSTKTRNNGNKYSIDSSKCIPTFSNCTYEDRGSVSTVLTGNNQIVINGYNSFYVTISKANKAVAKNGATMSKYRLVCGNQSVEANYSDTADVTLKLNHVTNMTFVVYAIDSRGYSQSVTKSVTTWKDYFAPAITTGGAERTEQVNEAVKLSFSGKIWNGNFGAEQNAITTCTYKYKKSSASEYTTGTTTITPTISGNKFSASLLIEGDAGANGFNISNSYNIQIALKDRIKTATYDIVLSAGTPAIAIGQGGVCFGGAYSEAHGGLIQLPTSKYFANRNTTA